MPRSALTGTRIRERRLMLGERQADLAALVEISPSYLNLIEHNRRRIAGRLLTRIAKALGVDMSVLTQGAEAEQLDQLGEAAAAYPDIATEMDRVDDFVGRFPGWAGLVAAQQRRILTLEHRVAGLVDRLGQDPFLAASMHELLSKISAIQSTASILVETEDLDDNWRKRFQRNLHADSAKLADGAASLVSYLEADSAAELGVMTPQEELEAFLNARQFHVAGLETPVPDLIEDLIRASPVFVSDAGRALARTYLTQYRAEAQAMPLVRFTDAAAELRHDPVRLAARFGVSIAAACRRLASLPQGDIGLVMCDGAGALVLRKPSDLLPLPRFGAACALWPLYAAMTRPMQPLRAVLEHAARPGARFVCYAFTQADYQQGAHMAGIFTSSMVVIPAELSDIGPHAAAADRIGTTCRVCPRADCLARREPSVLGDSADTALTAGPA